MASTASSSLSLALYMKVALCLLIITHVEGKSIVRDHDRKLVHNTADNGKEAQSHEEENRKSGTPTEAMITDLKSMMIPRNSGQTVESELTHGLLKEADVAKAFANSGEPPDLEKVTASGALKTMARPRTSSLLEAVEADDAKLAGEGKEAGTHEEKRSHQDAAKTMKCGDDATVIEKLVAQLNDYSIRSGRSGWLKISILKDQDAFTEDDLKAAIINGFCSAAKACKLLFQKVFPGQAGQIQSKGGVTHTIPAPEKKK